MRGPLSGHRHRCVGIRSPKAITEITTGQGGCLPPAFEKNRDPLMSFPLCPLSLLHSAGEYLPMSKERKILPLRRREFYSPNSEIGPRENLIGCVLGSVMLQQQTVPKLSDLKQNKRKQNRQTQIRGTECFCSTRRSQGLCSSLSTC